MRKIYKAWFHVHYTTHWYIFLNKLALRIMSSRRRTGTRRRLHYGLGTMFFGVSKYQVKYHSFWSKRTMIGECGNNFFFRWDYVFSESNAFKWIFCIHFFGVILRDASDIRYLVISGSGQANFDPFPPDSLIQILTGYPVNGNIRYHSG